MSPGTLGAFPWASDRISEPTPPTTPRHHVSEPGQELASHGYALPPPHRAAAMSERPSKWMHALRSRNLATFHVEHSFRTTEEIRSWLEGRQDQLTVQATDLPNEAEEMRSIELGSRIIE